jgi:hypothetical protein
MAGGTYYDAVMYARRFTRPLLGFEQAPARLAR